MNGCHVVSLTMHDEVFRVLPPLRWRVLAISVNLKLA